MKTNPWKRWGARLGWCVGGAVATLVALYIGLALKRHDEEPWHHFVPRNEFREAAREAPGTFDVYLALEKQLFEEVARFRTADGAASGPLGRFNPASPTAPEHRDPDWNRTFVLDDGATRGGALLLHGLSDSPYSLLPVGRQLAARGYRVVGLRLPGHGTVPGALRDTRWEDWTAAVRLAAADLAARVAPGDPFVVAGYSNGAALALDYSLEALDDPMMRRPDALVLLSPALAVTRMAALARWQLWLSRLPGLDKLAWSSLHPEYDPYKYNSFALNAAKQIYGLTGDLAARLDALEREGHIDELPPALAFQSVADATVPALPSLRRLYGRIGGNGSQVVLFDVNRRARVRAFLTSGADTMMAAARSTPPHAFAVTLVTNADEHTPEVVARSLDAGATAWRDEPLDLVWPDGIYSISHVAVPFPPDDRLYGSETHEGVIPLGRMEPRGERGGLTVPVEMLMRLRYNPFFPYQERRIAEFLDGVGLQQGQDR